MTGRLQRAIATLRRVAVEIEKRDYVRDADGRFATTGGGSTGVVFVSPERRTNRGLSDAGADLSHKQQGRLKAALRTINAKLGISGASTADAVGVWKDPTAGVGAEASTMTRTPRSIDLERLTVAAAMAGWLGEQKGVIAFKPDAAGADLMLTVTGLRGRASTVYNALSDKGVENVTLERTGKDQYTAHTIGFRGWVGDDGITALARAVATTAKEMGGRVTAAKGTANYVGADTRADALTEYAGVIDAYRKKRGSGRAADGARNRRRDGLDWWDDLAGKWRQGQSNRGEALAKSSDMHVDVPLSVKRPGARRSRFAELEKGKKNRAIVRRAKLHKSYGGCVSCTFYTGVNTCFAYPDGIPDRYSDGAAVHTEKHAGTGGFTYRRVSDSDVVTKALDLGVGPHLASWFGEIASGAVLKSSVVPSERIVVGFMYPNAKPDGTLVVDTQGDVVTMRTLEKTIAKFMAGPRTVGADHKRDDNNIPCRQGEVLESYLLTKSRRDALGLPDDMPLGWIGAAYVEDEPTWQRVVSGELQSFSVGGRAVRIPIANPG